MDWEQIRVLLDVARMANDHPKLHNLRNAALDQLETMSTPEAEEEE